MSNRINGSLLIRRRISVLILEVEFAVGGGQEMQGQTGIIHTLTDVIGDGTGVVHQTDRVLEHIGVDTLQDILSTLIRLDLESGIDVAMSKRQTADRLALDSEGINSMFHMFSRSP